MKKTSMQKIPLGQVKPTREEILREVSASLAELARLDDARQEILGSFMRIEESMIAVIDDMSKEARTIALENKFKVSDNGKVYWIERTNELDYLYPVEGSPFPAFSGKFKLGLEFRMTVCSEMAQDLSQFVQDEVSDLENK